MYKRLFVKYLLNYFQDKNIDNFFKIRKALNAFEKFIYFDSIYLTSLLSARFKMCIDI